MTTGDTFVRSHKSTESPATTGSGRRREVVFGTAAALSVPLATTRRRWHWNGNPAILLASSSPPHDPGWGALLIAAIRRMPLTAPDKPRRHYSLSPSTRSSLEAARMSREMDRR
jgi:hypothetical protein